MISDMVLLLIVLAGLLVIRRSGGGLTQLIWKQVRWQLLDRSFFLFTIFFTSDFFVRESFGSCLAPLLRFPYWLVQLVSNFSSFVYFPSPS